jgi:hypothetical protein
MGTGELVRRPRLSTVTDLASFLEARLAEDEAYARTAFASHNDAGPDWHEQWSGAVSIGDAADLIETGDSGVSRFIVRNDPSRVLREAAAKRAILSLCETETPETGGWPLALRIMRHFASVYQDHPEFDKAWLA